MSIASGFYIDYFKIRYNSVNNSYDLEGVLNLDGSEVMNGTCAYDFQKKIFYIMVPANAAADTHRITFNHSNLSFPDEYIADWMNIYIATKRQNMPDLLEEVGAICIKDTDFPPPAKIPDPRLTLLNAVENPIVDLWNEFRIEEIVVQEASPAFSLSIKLLSLNGKKYIPKFFAEDLDTCRNGYVLCAKMEENNDVGSTQITLSLPSIPLSAYYARGLSLIIGNYTNFNYHLITKKKAIFFVA